MILTVHQCLRILSKQRLPLCRQLRTCVKPECWVLPRTNEYPLMCQSRFKFRSIDFAAIKRDTIFYTGCNYYSSDVNKTELSQDEAKPNEGGQKKVGIVKRYKQMYKDYWYVILPVHMTTSAVWGVGCYYLAVKGVDLTHLLQSCGVPGEWIAKTTDSGAGNIVVALTLYKIASPLRYAVTIACSTVSINYLKKWNWIKPVPNKEELKRMYYERKGALKDFKSTYEKKIQAKKDDITKTKEDLKQQYVETRDGLQRSVLDSKKEFKEGVKIAGSEWKHIFGLMLKSVKRYVYKTPDYVARVIDDSEKPKKKR